MRELTRRKTDGDLADQLICDHALFHLEADLRWLELTAARLDELAAEVRHAVTHRADAEARCSSRPTCTRRTAPPRPWTAPRCRSRAGEVVAVMGPSGSGKSTLLHCLAGIVRPDSGQVRYRGRELSAMSDGERSALRRSEFGFVFQFGQLVPELTCLENVALPLRLDGVRAQGGRARAPRAGWSAGGRRRRAASGPARSPAARASGSPWPGRWSPGRGWSSPTSRPARWTRSTASG